MGPIIAHFILANESKMETWKMIVLATTIIPSIWMFYLGFQNMRWRELMEEKFEI